MLTALVHSAGGATKEEALQGLPVNLRSQLTQKGLWAPPAPPAGAPAEASAGGGKKPKGAAAAAAGGKKKAGGPQRPQLVLLRMSKVLETPQEDPFFETEAFRLSCLHASVVVRCATHRAGGASLPCRTTPPLFEGMMVRISPDRNFVRQMPHPRARRRL